MKSSGNNFLGEGPIEAAWHNKAPEMSTNIAEYYSSPFVLLSGPSISDEKAETNQTAPPTPAAVKRIIRRRRKKTKAAGKQDLAKKRSQLIRIILKFLRRRQPSFWPWDEMDKEITEEHSAASEAGKPPASAAGRRQPSPWPPSSGKGFLDKKPKKAVSDTIAKNITKNITDMTAKESKNITEEFSAGSKLLKAEKQTAASVAGKPPARATGSQDLARIRRQIWEHFCRSELSEYCSPLPPGYSTGERKREDLFLGSAAPLGPHYQHLPHEKEEITDSIKMKDGKITSREDHNKVIVLGMDLDFKINQDVKEGSHKYPTEKDDMFDKFENFPGYLKRCILYCYLFPLGYEFEKETLVQLWIADELINGEATDRIEDKADEYFEILARTEYIVPSQRDKAYTQVKYKVNEPKFPMSYLKKEGASSGEFVRTDVDGSRDISDMTLHLSFSDEKFDPQIFKALQKCKKLRTLLLLGHFGYSVNQVPQDLFLGLKCLRTLDLSQTKVSELPSTIGKLESLQYLDLSNTIIKELPEVLCCLKSLQTLKLRDCFYLLALPKDMRKLANLRHLDFNIVHQLSFTPKEMGKLKNLQTLPGFIVGVDDGYGIQELSNLRNITGSFCISRLENVSSVEEARKANLQTKRYLTKLELRWQKCKDAESEEQILECLVPYTGLQELQIQFFSGSVLPSWISNPMFSITSLTLYHCVNCHSLPSIGDLPRLKSLTIVAMYKVKNINRLFSNHGEGSTNQPDCAFPELEKLILDDMLDLEEWTGVKPGDFPKLLDICIRYCPKLPNLPSMSHLQSLKYMELRRCSDLQSLPDGDLPASLESLIIQDCPKLKECCCKDGEDWGKIAHVPSIWIDDDEISQVDHDDISWIDQDEISSD